MNDLTAQTDTALARRADPAPGPSHRRPRSARRPPGLTPAAWPRSGAVAAFMATKRSAETRRSYSRDLLAFAQAQGFETTAELLGATVADVCAWRDAMTAAELAPATVARRLAGVRAFFRFACAQGLTARNPAELVEAPMVEAHKARAPWIDRADARRLLVTPSDKTRLGLRDRAILAMLLRLGLRRGEVATLAAGSIVVTPAGWTLTVKGKRGKVRTLTMNGTAATVQAYLTAAGRDLATEAPAALLFPGRGGRPLTGEALRGIVLRHAAAAGVTVNGGATLSPHGCRRTFATVAIDNGTSMEALKRAMGHASVATTSRYDRRADADVTVSF